MPYRRPFRRRFRPRFRRRFRRNQVGPSLHRTRWTFRKRVGQNLTREVRWFKDVGPVSSQLGGFVNDSITGAAVAGSQQFDLFGRIWEEYKVLKIIVKWFPANVGGESLQAPSGTGVPVGAPLLQRGDCVTWIDPNTPTPPPPSSINDVMGKSSAMIVQPRRLQKRWMSRPRGYPTWGSIGPNGIIANLDPWDGSINMYGDNFTPSIAPGQQVFFWRIAYYKVLFRSRQDQ